jgi:hypothetical protein
MDDAYTQLERLAQDFRNGTEGQVETAMPRRCLQRIGEHMCHQLNCPKDDPDHVHVCYADDFDWADGDFVRLKRGELTEQEFLLIGTARAQQRHHGQIRADGTLLDNLDKWRAYVARTKGREIEAQAIGLRRRMEFERRGRG